jgi:ATP synthase protein I
MQGLGFAFRVGTELVAATGIGVAVGYGLDLWLGTSPWLLILFLFLGGAAGVSNVYRLVSGMDDGVGWRRPGKDPGQDDGRE